MEPDHRRHLVLPVINPSNLPPGFKMSASQPSFSPWDSSNNSGEIQEPAECVRRQPNAPRRPSEELKSPQTGGRRKKKHSYVVMERINREQQQPGTRSHRPSLGSPRKNKGFYQSRGRAHASKASFLSPSPTRTNRTAKRFRSKRRIKGYRTPSPNYTRFSSPTNNAQDYISFVEPVTFANTEGRQNDSVGVPIKKLEQKVGYSHGRRHSQDAGTGIFLNIPKTVDKTQMSSLQDQPPEPKAIDYLMMAKQDMYVNWHPRQIFRNWRKETSKANFLKKRDQLRQQFWLVQQPWSQFTNQLKLQILAIDDFRGVNVSDRRYTEENFEDFTAEQAVYRQKAIENLDRVTNDIIISLTDMKAELGDDLDLETQKIQPSFLLVVKVFYTSRILQSLHRASKRLKQVLSGTQTPRFDCVLAVSDDLSTTPEIDIIQHVIISSLEQYHEEMLSHPAIDRLQRSIQHMEEHLTAESLSAQLRENFMTDQQTIQEELDVEGILQKDIHETHDFLLNQNWLISSRQQGLLWLETIQSSEIDIIDFYRQNYSEIGLFKTQLLEIPSINIDFGIISIQTSNLLEEMTEIPQQIQRNLRDSVCDVFCRDTEELRNELVQNFEVMKTPTKNLRQYISQLKSIKYLTKEQLQEFSERLSFIFELERIIQSENLDLPDEVTNFDDIQRVMSDINSRIRSCKRYCESNKDEFKRQLKQENEKLSTKIDSFTKKYKSRYLNQPDRISNTEQVLTELKQRAKTIEKMQKKVEKLEDYTQVIFEFNKDSKKNLSEPCQSNNRQKYEGMTLLHTDTQLLWAKIQNWQNSHAKWTQSKFVEISLSEMEEGWEDAKKYLVNSSYLSENFSSTARAVMFDFKKQVKEMMKLIEMVAKVKSVALDHRHWEQIFGILSRPNFEDMNFTLTDLVDAEFQEFDSEIQKVIDSAGIEGGSQLELTKFQEQWQSLSLTFTQDKIDHSMYIASNLNDIQDQIAEQQIVLQGLKNDPNAQDVQEDVELWKGMLEHMDEVLELWSHVQTECAYLFPIFQIQAETTSKEIDKFASAQYRLKDIIEAAKHQTNAMENLKSVDRKIEFQDILKEFTSLRKNLHDYCESKRLQFPRLFFLCDGQLLELLAAANTENTYDTHISAIFPNVSKFWLNQHPHNDSASLDFDLQPGEKDMIEDLKQDEEAGVQSFDSDVDDTSWAGIEGAYQSCEQRNEGMPNLMACQQILGLVGHNADVLTFNRSVSVTEQPEVWMMEVEIQMKDTLSKLIQKAVNDFPKQHLDEWILDFPQQIIYSSIYLILTHEIDDLLADLQLENRESKPSSLDIDPPQDVPEEFEDHFSYVYIETGTLTRIMDERKLQLMKILQARSLQGLYLRLQFWVNQILKSMKRDDQDRLTQNHKVAFESIISLLIYQRDIVNQLISKNVLDPEDFEWLKHLRIQWNSAENFAKIEIGGLSLVQGNEYLGVNPRYLCNPITTRSFLFISSALREHSSVLFRTNKSHDFAGDVFAEFSSICAMPFKKFHVQECTNVTSAMQYLNGSALANMWCIFEHVDRLSALQLQVLAKEIQMVQQQFMIAEMGEDTETSQSACQDDENASGSIQDSKVKQEQASKVMVNMSASKASSKAIVNMSASIASNKQDMSASKASSKRAVPERSGVISISQSRISRKSEAQEAMTKTYTSEYASDSDSSIQQVKVPMKLNHNLFVVFASLSPNYNQHTDSTLMSTLQNSFRCIELIKPDFSLLITFYLVQNGFRRYRKLKSILINFFQSIQQELPDLHISTRDVRSIMQLSTSYLTGERSTGRDCQALIKACSEYLSTRVKPEETVCIDTAVEKVIGLKVKRDKDMENWIPEVIEKLQLRHENWQVTAVKQLKKMILLHRAVALVGPPASGKSTVLSILEQGINATFYKNIDCKTIFPSIFTQTQLFGEVENHSKHGILQKIISQFSDDSQPAWLQLKCMEIANKWAESLIPLMENTLLLSRGLRGSHDQVTLPNSVNLHLPAHIQLIFEAQQVWNCSPAFLSRIGIIYVGNQLSWEAMVETISLKISQRFKLAEDTAKALSGYIFQSYAEILEKCSVEFIDDSNWNVQTLTCSFSRLILALWESSDIHTFIENAEKISEQFEYVTLLAFVWSYGAVLNQEQRIKFNTILKESKTEIAQFIPPKDIFEYYLDFDKCSFSPIMFGKIRIYSPIPVLIDSSLVVPTKIHYQTKYLLDMLSSPVKSTDKQLVSQIVNVSLVGPNGSGKSSIVKLVIPDQETDVVQCSVHGLCSISKIQSAFSKQKDRKLAIVIEDLHLDKSNIQEWLSSTQLNQGFYSTDLEFQWIENVSILTTGNPTTPLESGTHRLYIDDITESVFKYILMRQLESGQKKVNVIIEKYKERIATIMTIFMGYTKTAPSKVTKCLNVLMQATSEMKIDVSDLDEKDMVAAILFYEMKFSFGNDVTANAVQSIREAFGKPPPSVQIFVDYTERPLRYKKSAEYARTELARQVHKRSRSEQLMACTLYPDNQAEIEELCRILSFPGSSALLWSCSAVDVLSIATSLLGKELLEPKASKRNSWAQFYLEFMGEVEQLLESEEKAVTSKWMMVRMSHLFDEKIFDFIYAYTTGDIRNILSPNVLQKLDVFCRYKGISLDSAVKYVAESIQFVLVIDKKDNFDYLKSRYPQWLFKIEFVHKDQTLQSEQVKSMSLNYLQFLRCDEHEKIATIMNEIFFYLQQTPTSTLSQGIDEGVRIDIPEYFSLTRISKCLDFYISLRQKLQNAMEEKLKSLGQQIYTVEQLQKLAEPKLRMKSELKDYIKNRCTYIDDITTQVTQLETSSIEEELLIGQLQESVVMMQEKVYSLEHYIQNDLQVVSKTLSTCMTKFNKYVAQEDLEKVIGKNKYFTGNAWRILETVAIVISDDESVTLDIQTVQELLRNKQTLTDKMQIIPTLSETKLAKLADTVTCVTIKTLPSTLTNLFYFLEALLSYQKTVLRLAPQTDELKTLKDTIEEQDIDQVKKSELLKRYSLEIRGLGRRKKTAVEELKVKQIEYQEVKEESSRTKNAVEEMIEFKQSLWQKKEKVEARIANISGDCIVLAANVMFLGIFRCLQRMYLRSQIRKIIENHDVLANSVWGMPDDISHLKIFRQVFKYMGFDALDATICYVTPNIAIYESLFAYLLAPACTIFIDEQGSIGKLIADVGTDQEVVHLSAADRISKNLLQTALEDTYPLFIHDYNDPHPESDLDVCKIGPGACQDYYILHRLSQTGLDAYNTKKNSLKNRPIQVVSGKFSPFQATFFQSRLNLSLNQEYFSNAVFFNACDIDIQQAWIDIQDILIKHTNSEAWVKMGSVKAECINLRILLCRIRRQSSSLLTQNGDKTIEDFDEVIAHATDKNAIKLGYNKLKDKYHKKLNSHLQCASFASVIQLFYISLSQLGHLTNDVTYSWDSFLFLVDSVVSKTMRDRERARNSEENANKEIDEDFFFRVLITQIWVSIAAGIPQQHFGLYSLIATINIAVKREEISEQEYGQFCERFLQTEGAFTWMTSFEHHTYQDGDCEKIFASLKENASGDMLPVVEYIGKELESRKFEVKSVPGVLREILERGIGRDLPQISRIWIALHYPDKCAKRLLRQFIHEQLNDIFEYTEEHLKLHTFVKNASWNYPIGLFSTPGINIVNTICSLANYFGVGLEVIRTDPENEKEDSIELIERCINDGSWVLISTSKFISNFSTIWDTLDQARCTTGFSNAFRMFIDLQGLRHFEIPDSFLHQNCIRFYMSPTNAEDIEGYNDIWGNLLNEDILSMKDMLVDDTISATQGQIESLN